mmetsp:Transcript_1188/g.3139  ORF Transcript_1188/g.3139 Transcript_1188/m.3139 type:complete len:114 (+) Transcript_1188:112-453(+)
MLSVAKLCVLLLCVYSCSAAFSYFTLYYERGCFGPSYLTTDTCVEQCVYLNGATTNSMSASPASGGGSIVTFYNDTRCSEFNSMTKLYGVLCFNIGTGGNCTDPTYNSFVVKS